MSQQSDEHLKKLTERAKEAKLVRKIVFIVISALIVIVLLTAGFAYYYINHALDPVNASSEKKVEVKIPIGSSVTEIGQNLEDKGVIRNATIFRYYIKYKNENDFQAGVYQFSPSNTIDEIIAKLKNGKVYQKAQLTIAIPEGLWTIDIAERIAKKTDMTQKDILKKLKDRDYIEKTYMKEYPFLKDTILNKDIIYPLEGYLFPATYQFTKKDPTLEDVIRKMLNKTQSVLDKYQSQIAESKLGSVHKILTLASIIEEEANKKVDRRKIASVFYNRLEIDMPLQTDPTISYAKQEHLVTVSYDDLEVDSPYNTYQNPGLPVGPIANPGENSIKAAINPEETDYKYFYARPSGEVMFSKTLEEHNTVKNKYKHEWAELDDKEE